MSEASVNYEDALNKEHISQMFYSVKKPMPDESNLIELQSNDCFEVGLVIAGSGIHCINGENFPCKGNDIYIISPNTPHQYFITDKCKELVIRKLVFKPNEWLKGDAIIPTNKHYCYGAFNDGASFAYAMLDSRTREKIDYVLDSIECELLDKEKEWKSFVRTYIIQLFALIGRYVSYSIKNSPDKLKNDEDVSYAIKIIENEFDNFDLSLETLSKRIYTSPTQLSRNFKLCTGRLFSEYLRETRLKKAALLLKTSELSVEKIISRCGFRDTSTFHRNFREFFGMTPQIYRQVSKTFNQQENKTNGDNTKKMEILNQISENVQIGKAKIVAELVQQAIDNGANPEEILDQGLLKGMGIIGEKFKNNEVFVPQVLVAARAMNKGTEILKPHLVANGVEASGKVCIGTVRGDLHDIGKNLVKIMMEGKGLEVIDLGTDVAPEAFITTAVENNCQVICCSALLTTTMPVMAEVIKAAEDAGIRDKVKIMIGGAPVTQEFCNQIGADCYTPDAATAAIAAANFCRK